MTIAVVDVTETLVPIVAGVACLRAARRSVEAQLAWVFVGAGVIAWGLGQAVWTYYEVWRGSDVPFPSLADAGFLTFPVLASIGVVLYRASSRRRRSRLTTILDGALLAASLFTLFWFVLLQGLVAEGDLSTYGFWLSFAYPLSDLVMVTLVLQVVSQLRTAPTSLWLLSLGLVVMAVADSAFVWLILTGAFSTGGWVDLAWITAFAIIGAAGVQACRDSDHDEGRADVTRLALVLPYVPFTLGMVVLAERVWTDDVGGVETLSAAVLIVLVLCRQYVALADNQGLLVLVRAREAQLSHLALHDPLTGLANRILLDDRMTHAAARRDDGSDGPVLLLIDLDDFKQVNDQHGHEAGDTVLVAVASRLSACVRSHDTVARLGGDEFVILLEPPTDLAEDVAQRVLDALAARVDLDGTTVRLSASVGIGAVDRGFDAEATRVARALREADMAMYAAKAAGKNRWRRYGPDVAAFAGPQPQDRSSPSTGLRESS